jgi:glutamine synthetase
MDQSLAMLEEFMAANSSVKYFWMQAIDYTGTTRQRMIPLAQFRKHIASGNYPGMTSALPRLLQNEIGAEGCSATGQFQLMFDTSTLSLNKVIESPSATVQTWWMDDSAAPLTEHHYTCPRWALKKQITKLKQEFDITMLMGFEIEIIFMRPVMNESKSDFERFDTLHMSHSWSNMTYQQLDMLPIVEEIVETLAELDIHLPQFHSEAAPGQWEFPLPAFEPVRAIDVLYKARDVIRFVARKHGLKATLYPRPYTFTCGSASHAHFSINGPDDTVEQYSESFLAGILEHLPSILAFTLPLEESYQRILAGIWAGGEYVAWGTQNRETALRKCGPGHWELKTVDGIGNMYLSMAAIVAAGISGIQEGLELAEKDCPYDVSTLSEEQRAEYGVSKKLPKTLTASLGNLDQNRVLRDTLGDRLIDDYVAVKKAEMKMLGGKSEDERRTWLISRY